MKYWIALLGLATAMLNSAAYAEPEANALFGAWSSYYSCTTPDYQFADKKITMHMDADGNPFDTTYDHIRYVPQENGDILIDFGAQHGHGNMVNKTSMMVRLIDTNTLHVLTFHRKTNLPKGHVTFTRCS